MFTCVSLDIPAIIQVVELIEPTSLPTQFIARDIWFH